MAGAYVEETMRGWASMLVSALVVGAVVAGCRDAPEADVAPSASAPTEEAVVPSTPAGSGEAQRMPAVHPEVGVAPAAGAAQTLIGPVVCRATGQAGTTVRCPLRVAVAPDGTPPRALQGTLHYDPTVAEFVGFFTEVCPRPDLCVEQQLGPNAPVVGATGHTLAISPRVPAEWAGRGSFILANLSDPARAISEAPVGSPEARRPIVEARFVLLDDVPQGRPFTVELDGLVAADDAAREIEVFVRDGVVVAGRVLDR